jgi:integrase
MASILPVKGKWRALIRLKGHEPKCKTFDTKAKARDWAAKIETDLREGKQPVDEAVTVGSLIKTYKKMRDGARPVLDTSNEHYQLKMLDRDLGLERVTALTSERMVAWAKARAQAGAGPYTVNCDLSKLGTVIRHSAAFLNVQLPDVVGQCRPLLKHLKLIGGGGKRERRVTEDELFGITEWLAENRGQIYADAVVFAVATAMRRGEITRVLWADVDRKRKLLLIRDRKDPRVKQGNDQWIPLLPEAWSILERLEKSGERIFPIHPQTLSKYHKDACDALSIPDLHLHDTRHEGTSQLFEEGYDIPEVALITGHKDWRHLKRYTNLKPESLHAGPKRPSPKQ